MSHNIKQEGDTAFAAYARKPAWHLLGEVTEDAMTASEVLSLAHLADWDVRKEPITTESGLIVPDKYATVMTDPVTGDHRALGVVGEQYIPIQNEEHVAFLDAFVDQSGAHFETGGALGRGEKVFVSMVLPDGIMINGSDPVNLYVGALNYHDGTGSFTMQVTPIRWECQNMINYSLGLKNQPVFKVRHVGAGLQGAVQAAREALGMTFRYLEEFEQEAQRLADTAMTTDKFEEMVMAEWGVKPNEDYSNFRSVALAEQKVGEMVSLFNGQTNEGIRETAWAGYNSITEYFDWIGGTATEESKALRSLDGKWANQALRVVKSFVDA